MFAWVGVVRRVRMVVIRVRRFMFVSLVFLESDSCEVKIGL